MPLKCTLHVYHSQNVSGKPGWKVNGARLFGSFQQKISGSNGTYFFRTECSKRKFVFHIFKAIFDTSFRLRGRFSVVEMICTYGKRNSGMKFTSPEFCLPFPQTVNRSVCPRNGKQSRYLENTTRRHSKRRDQLK